MEAHHELATVVVKPWENISAATSDPNRDLTWF
jgi:hypothetical protein